MSTCGGLMDFFPANFMLQVPNNDQNDHQGPHGFHGIAPMLGKRTTPFSGMDGFCEEGNGGEDGDNLSDDGFQLGEKKRRLSLEQVRALEKSFELGNKLEPERKSQLAKALGLRPRQVAIWFQNRRARWKTKQLEKDYVILKRQFEALKVDNESILLQNHKLQSEISTFKGKNPTERINLNKETEQGSSSTRSENSSDIKRDISTTTTHMNTEGNRSAFFTQPPSSSYTVSRANGPTARLFQNPPDLHCHRLDQSVREEGFTNMFPGMDDHSGFWPWVDHHNYS